MSLAAIKQSLSPRSPHDERAIGVALALLAYLSWGLLPLYWKQLQGVPSSQAVAHRIVWSAAFCLIWLTLQRRLPELVKVFFQWRTACILCATGTLLGVNWLVYIWAVNQNRVLESSLGYFMTPLMNVLLGTVVLRETLRPKQWIAVALATAGVLNFALRLNALPWIALCLALTFSTYGLVRKQTAIKPIVGLAVEMIALSPLATIFLFRVHQQGVGAFGYSSHNNLF
ncbi:MAG: EamA family transporter RarD [Myxococcales bacterium]|nr:MAG: EamA family transporter RarD [Myxococcales bacterium]